MTGVGIGPLLKTASFSLFFFAMFALLSLESSVSYLFLILLPPLVVYLFYRYPIPCFLTSCIFFCPNLRPLFLLDTESI